MALKVKVIQSYLILYNPVDCTVHGILQAKLLEWVTFPLLQGIFPTQGSNPGLPHCRQILYQFCHKGSPRILEWHPIPSPTVLPNSVIEPGSPALQDSLPTELPGKPTNGIMKSSKNIARALKFCFLSFTDDERWENVWTLKKYKN